MDGKIFKVYKAKAKSYDNSHILPSTIIDITQDGILVKCGEDAILLEEVQLEGKKRMSAYAFACGKRLKPGMTLS